MLRIFMFVLLLGIGAFALASCVPSDLPNIHMLVTYVAWLIVCLDVYLFAYVLKFVVVGRALGAGWRMSRRRK